MGTYAATCCTSWMSDEIDYNRAISHRQIGCVMGLGDPKDTIVPTKKINSHSLYSMAVAICKRKPLFRSPGAVSAHQYPRKGYIVRGKEMRFVGRGWVWLSFADKSLLWRHEQGLHIPT